MNDIEIMSSFIKKDSEEKIQAVYSATPATATGAKKMLISSLLTVTAIMFAVCFYIIVFCHDIKKGHLVYDSSSYWIVISFIAIAYLVIVLDILIVCTVYYFAKKSSSKTSCQDIRYALTNRSLIIANIKTNEVLASIALSEIDDICRYVDEQLKIVTYSGKDYIIRPDDFAGFIDTYPGLLRSERQRARHLAKEAQ